MEDSEKTCIVGPSIIPKCAGCGKPMSGKFYWLDQVEGHSWFYHPDCLPENYENMPSCRMHKIGP